VAETVGVLDPIAYTSRVACTVIRANDEVAMRPWRAFLLHHVDDKSAGGEYE
jgi:hypothetical protein